MTARPAFGYTNWSIKDQGAMAHWCADKLKTWDSARNDPELWLSDRVDAWLHDNVSPADIMSVLHAISKEFS